MEYDNDNIVSMTDENGEEVQFEFIDAILYNDEMYVVLIPCEDTDEAESVLILQVANIGTDTEEYVSVDDDQILNEVFEIFKEKFKDEFDFVD